MIEFAPIVTAKVSPARRTAPVVEVQKGAAADTK
jgi:hypothetical protein